MERGWDDQDSGHRLYRRIRDNNGYLRRGIRLRPKLDYSTRPEHHVSGKSLARRSLRCVELRGREILHAYCLKLTPDTLGSDGEIHYPSSKDLNLDLSWAKWLRLYLYADYEEDVTVKIRLHQDAGNYLEGTITVKAKEWRKYEIAISSLSKIGDPSLSQINWISIISPYPILIDSDHVFLPAIRELMRVKFTLRRDSPDDPSPKIKLVKLVWREGA